jgi:exodeoxyribonuclease X
VADPRTLFRVIDFETSGIPTEDEKHAICEIGFCDVTMADGAWTVGEVRSMFVNPGRPIAIEARAVHHIPDSVLFDAPPVTLGFTALMADMDPASTCFVAHNAAFEQEFFGGGEVPWVCTYKSALRIWPDAPSHSNQVLRYFLDLDLDHDTAMPPHRAGPDAYVTAHLMARILDSGADPEDLIRWTSGPALLPRCPLHKHKGKKWEDVPTDYLNFIVFKSSGLSRDVIANAKLHLKKRGAI